MKRSLLKKVLSYNPETGNFIWLKTLGSKRGEGSIAGSKNTDGYIIIGIYGKRYMAHRLAWLYMTGRWPAQDLDHINRVPHDNRMCNLREASRSQNNANRIANKLKKHPLPKGVKFFPKCRKPYCASITKNGKAHSLGYFFTPELAHDAYLKKARELFGKFARSSA